MVTARERQRRAPSRPHDPPYGRRPAFRPAARRGHARRAGAGAIRIIGSRYSPEAMALRAFANRYRLPHTWIDLEDIDDPPVYLASIGVRPPDVPVVVTPTALLRRPTPGRFAEHLGLTYR